MLKKALRSTYQSLRLSLSDTEYEQGSIVIANACLDLPIWHLHLYHLFISIPEKREVDTSFLIPVLHGRDKKIAVPKVVPGKRLEHYLLEDTTSLVRNHWGISEPRGGKRITPEQIDVVFVPLLAFDASGHRVGYGGGYYDRFLESCRPDAIRVGLSLFPPVEEISDLHPGDMALTYCVTPKEVFEF